MMYFGEKPWHKLGNEVAAAQTSAEAIVAAGLDWKVSKEQLLRQNGAKADGAVRSG